MQDEGSQWSPNPDKLEDFLKPRAKSDEVLLKPSVSSAMLQKVKKNLDSRITGHQSDPKGHLSWLWTNMWMLQSSVWVEISKQAG